MEDKKLHKFTAKIADIEPFVFSIELSEEPVFRRAAYLVNELWQKMGRENPGRTPHFVLGKVALGLAELYCRKADQLRRQEQLMDDFEKRLDEFLAATDR